MANIIRTLRSTTAAARPTGREFGELYWNNADQTLGIIDDTDVAQDIFTVGNEPFLWEVTDNTGAATPIAGQMVVDADPRDLVTEIKFHIVDRWGRDRTGSFNANLVAGDIIHLGDDTGGSSYTVTGTPTLVGDVYTVTVSFIRGVGGLGLGALQYVSFQYNSDTGGGPPPIGGSRDPMYGMCVWNDNINFVGGNNDERSVTILRNVNLTVSGRSSDTAGNVSNSEDRIAVLSQAGGLGRYAAFFGGAGCGGRQSCGINRAMIGVNWNEGRPSDVTDVGPFGYGAIEAYDTRFLGAVNTLSEGNNGNPPGTSRCTEHGVWVQSANPLCRVSGVRIEWGVFDPLTGDLLAGSGNHTITRRDPGRYTITLATPMTDPEYGINVQGAAHKAGEGVATIVTSSADGAPPVNQTLDSFEAHSSRFAASSGGTNFDQLGLSFMCYETGPVDATAPFRGEWVTYDQVNDAVRSGTAGLTVANVGAAAPDFTVTFATAMQDDTYLVLGSTARDLRDGSYSCQMTGGNNGLPEEKTTTTVQMRRMALGTQNALVGEWQSMLFIEPQ